MNKYPRKRRAATIIVSALTALTSIFASLKAYAAEGETENDMVASYRKIRAARTLEVCYVTTRANDGNAFKPSYNARRNLDLGAGSLEYGACQVEKPRSATSLLTASSFPQFKASMEALDKEWLAATVKRFDGKSLPDFLVKVKNWKGPILVYIHGYDESFDKAIKDTAEIANQYDIQNDDAILPITFSWPSLNNKAEYAADEANLEWSTAAFCEFLDTLRAAKNVESPLDIVAHSLGNRALIQYCVQQKSEVKPFRNIVLSSADVDFHMAETRKEDIESAAEKSVTVIVSDRDAPLMTSQLLHRQPRLGRPIDPPQLRGQTADFMTSDFWTRLTLDASALILPNALNADVEVNKWLSANANLSKDFGQKSIFVDTTDLVSGEMGHRLVFPVIAGVLSGKLNPLGTGIVYKRPDKATLEASGGTPRYLYRFYKIDSQKFRK